MKIRFFYSNIKTKYFFSLQDTSTMQNIICNIKCILYYIRLISFNASYDKLNVQNKKISKLLVFKQKVIIGALSAFIFWLPFWGFILAEILHFALYMVFACIVFILTFMLGCYILNSNKSKISIFNIYDLLTFFKDSFLLCYWAFLCLCVIINSLLHGNAYIITSLFYPISIAIFLFLPRYYRFYFGFFIGIFGFYWMTLSFRFQDLGLFIPFAIICVGIIYGIFLWFMLFFQNLICRIIALCLLFVLYPLDFNWFNVAYLSSYGIFSSSMISMLLLALSFFLTLFKSKIRYISFLLLLMALDYNFTIQMPKLKADIIETHYGQDERWLAQNKKQIIEESFNAIQNAIDKKYPMVILPETSFPFILNKEFQIYDKLRELSNKIIIFVGSIRLQEEYIKQDSKINYDFIELDKVKNNVNIISPEESYINYPTQNYGYYNTIFVFTNNRSIIADKVSLVPFGETLPYNDTISPIFKSIFGESFGFNKGDKIVTLMFKDMKIAIANCYEGTLTLPYNTNAKYIIMMSNNAWFYPSTQSLMQQMIVKYYAKSYNAFVYHSTNYTKKAIITPNNGKDNIDLSIF